MDDFMEGIWEWFLVGVNFGYIVWVFGQLDNGYNEDCVLLFYFRNYLWNDDQCDNFYYFICEKE